MESSEVISTDKATVIIQVNPQVTRHAVISEDGQETGGAYTAYHNTALKEFVRAQPKALGAVQIMTGAIVLLLGIVRTSGYYYDYGIHDITGITYWGSLIYIIAGSLCVAAQNKLHLCVVKAALIMNVFSAITAATSIVLMSRDIHEYSRYSPIHDRVIGVLLVFYILQFIISIFISGFACKATSNTNSTVVNVELNQGK